MRGVYLFGGLLLLIILQACREDDSYKPYPPAKDSTEISQWLWRTCRNGGRRKLDYLRKKSLNLFSFSGKYNR